MTSRRFAGDRCDTKLPIFPSFSWYGKLDSVASLASGGVSEANVAALSFRRFLVSKNIGFHN